MEGAVPQSLLRAFGTGHPLWVGGGLAPGASNVSSSFVGLGVITFLAGGSWIKARPATCLDYHCQTYRPLQKPGTGMREYVGRRVFLELHVALACCLSWN